MSFWPRSARGTSIPGSTKRWSGARRETSFTFERDYPENTAPFEFAGKSVRFDITIKEIKEKEVPELDDEFATIDRLGSVR